MCPLLHGCGSIRVALWCLLGWGGTRWFALVPNWGLQWWEGNGALAKRGAGNTRKSGFYIERGRDGVRMS